MRFLHPSGKAALKITDASRNAIAGSFNLYGVQENYMNATMGEFYYPSETSQDYLTAMKDQNRQVHIVNGYPDPVQALFYQEPEPPLDFANIKAINAQKAIDASFDPQETLSFTYRYWKRVVM